MVGKTTIKHPEIDDDAAFDILKGENGDNTESIDSETHAAWTALYKNRIMNGKSIVSL